MLSRTNLGRCFLLPPLSLSVPLPLPLLLPLPLYVSLFVSPTVKNEPLFDLDESTLGETFDVAVSGAVFGLIQAIVVFCFFRRAGDGPGMRSSCCSSNGLPVRTPRVQQPSKQQYAAGA